MTVIERPLIGIRGHMGPKSRSASREEGAAARRALRDQIARLDGELAALGEPLPAPRSNGAGAALQSLGALELHRDALAARAAAVRQALDEQGERQELARRAREEMLLEPERHRLARITNADVGEPGCRDWHVRPRFGLLGMLAGWWRVVVSSGCPLPKAPRRPRSIRSTAWSKKEAQPPISSSRTRTATP
jgi:hypothetical protein